ncbi:uncharacterized protein LOC121377217 isoform X2 [Gigantopelta aegis]|uniref:uncharacterized protein LOC121377217 isoform X2 n=1 Tax=Gigantopelta aegis TaxID=1735272 RepID=UPI001B88939F|nr:uncharacterized protein LOC121377217 isoform X2 [Gigantopelta aegis]
MEDVNSYEQDSYMSTMPADYSNAQSNSYDPDFISDIGHRMQIPDRISMDGNTDLRGGQNRFPSHMFVPDRILVAGDEKHIGLKSGLQTLDFSNVGPSSDSMSYVGLITPPRTLTLEERFPIVEETEMQSLNKIPPKLESNGLAPMPYTPGISPNDMVLLNEEDETTLLRTQVAKIARRLTVMEQDNQRRANRELFLYPAVFGYFMMKVLWWFFKSR